MYANKFKTKGKTKPNRNRKLTVTIHCKQPSILSPLPHCFTQEIDKKKFTEIYPITHILVLEHVTPLQIKKNTHQASYIDILIFNLVLQKRNLCEVFTIAQVSSKTWDVFIKVKDFFESGKLKDQQFSINDVVKGTLCLKQWHMKPLVSLADELKLILLNKVRRDLNFHLFILNAKVFFLQEASSRPRGPTHIF